MIAPPVEAPTPGADPRTVLATNLHAAPGLYAVLVGSGLSTAAGIPTGWQVVQDLVRKIAAARGVDLSAYGEEPEPWWEERGLGPPRYDRLLEELSAGKAGARQELVRQFFEATPLGTPITPTEAHRAIARLCARGAIRLIVTTNFDHLIERALEEVGVTAQVVAEPSAIRGMRPLTQMGVTVLKPNGDYTRPGTMRNTPEELGKYQRPWEKLLAQVFDGFGLLVCGWSASYDTALVANMTKSPARRYPLFWVTRRGDRTEEEARRLMEDRGACVVDCDDADELFKDIEERLIRLDQVALRRGKPKLLRHPLLSPNSVSAPPGWAALPRLQLRVGSIIGPASGDDCDILRPRFRQAFCEALEKATIVGKLINYLPEAEASAARASCAYSNITHTKGGPYHWVNTPDDNYQSTWQASFRWGSDASNGVSALVRLTLPMMDGAVGAQITLDIGLANRIDLEHLCGLLRDGLLLVAAELMPVLETVLPPSAQPIRAALHLLASRNNGKPGSDFHDRDNDLLQMIDVNGFGQRHVMNRLWELHGAEFQVQGSLTQQQFIDLVIEWVERFVLDIGYLDYAPERVTSLRRSLHYDVA